MSLDDPNDWNFWDRIVTQAGLKPMVPSKNNVETLLDSCPEDESIFIFYGVLWDAMLEANHPWADGVKWLIDNRVRPYQSDLVTSTGLWYFHAAKNWKPECRIPYQVLDEMRSIIGPPGTMGSVRPSGIITLFLEAYHALYAKVPA